MPLNKMKLRHRLLVALFLLLLAGGWLLWNFKRPATPSAPFDPLAWKQPAETAASSTDAACLRGAMALDLIQKDLLPGKSAPQLLELLGVPDEKGGGDWTYHLGECPGLGWNDSDLRVQFDAGTTLVKSATIEHVTVKESR